MSYYPGWDYVLKMEYPKGTIHCQHRWSFVSYHRTSYYRVFEIFHRPRTKFPDEETKQFGDDERLKPLEAIRETCQEERVRSLFVQGER